MRAHFESALKIDYGMKNQQPNYLINLTPQIPTTIPEVANMPTPTGVTNNNISRPVPNVKPIALHPMTIMS